MDYSSACLSCSFAAPRGRGAAVTWVLRDGELRARLSTLQAAQPGRADGGLRSDGKTRLGFIQSDDLVRPVPAKRDARRCSSDATIAIEDERFYKHTGVDYEGIIRAAVKNGTSHKTVQGGSTLTMQLVRLLYTADDTRAAFKGFERKIREAPARPRARGRSTRRSGSIGSTSTRCPTGRCGGQSAIGAGAAARLYFDKGVQDLTLREAAMLAGMPQAPSSYSPVLNPERDQAAP